MFWNKHAALRVVSISSAIVLTFCAASVCAQRAEKGLIGPGRCSRCHTELPDAELRIPAETFALDIHAKAGLGCADCHAGNAQAGAEADAHAASAGFIGIPEPMDVPKMCASCHSDVSFMISHNPALPVDQLDKYSQSRHGELLKMGLRKVAQCASCHTAHSVRPANDPLSSTYPANLPGTCASCHADARYMAGFPIPTDQFDKYAASVHGQALLEAGDLGAPACNDCHGNHGAIPPDVKSLGHVCGSCHALNADLAAKSAHAEVFEAREIAMCTVCHGHHAIAPPSPEAFAMGPESSCLACHRRGDPGWEAGRRMFEAVSALIALRAEAEAALDNAQEIGMDVADARFLLVDFRKAFLGMRTESHELDAEAYLENAAKARAQLEEVLLQAEEAVEEFHLRRRGLGFSLLLSLPVVVFLFMLITRLDSDAERERKVEGEAGRPS